MRKSFKSLILVVSVSLLILAAGASMTIAFPSSTTECGTSGCHNTYSLTVTSNATGAVNATVGKPFILNIDAIGYTGGDQAFFVNIESSWADNDQFSFTTTSIQDNGTGDLNVNLNEISISVEFTPTSAGTHTLRIWAAGSNDVAGSLDVVVSSEYDANAPFVDSPADVEYEYLETGNSITWNPVDPNPATYSINRNGEVLFSGIWNGSSIYILIDWLIPGTYEYTLYVYNVGGFVASDTVIVTVTLASTTTPTTTTPTTTTTTTTTDTTTQTTQPPPSGQPLGPAVVTPVTLVVSTWAIIIFVTILISEILIRKGKW